MTTKEFQKDFDAIIKAMSPDELIISLKEAGFKMFPDRRVRNRFFRRKIRLALAAQPSWIPWTKKDLKAFKKFLTETYL